VLQHYNEYKRSRRRELSYRVPTFEPYSIHNKRSRELFLAHTQSMPSVAPSPLVDSKATLSHSASDIPVPFTLDEAEQFSCENEEKHSLTLKDLDFIQMIGTGMYSKVYLVQSKLSSKDYFALKVIPKYKLKTKSVSGKSEADIMLSLDHPLIVKTWNTFEDEKNMYMLMDFATGGELFYHLRAQGRFNEDTVRFYAAEVVLALEHLHNKNIVFRDLKLENLVLSDQGHIQLTDFGFAKELEDSRTFTLCGTPEYLAPEIIRGTGYGMGVDWWALGVLIFEMLAGYSPFYSHLPLEIYKNILRGSIRFSSCMSENAKDLLKGLLTRDMTSRLGRMQGGVSELRSHPFFANIDWENISTMTPPIVPSITGRGDTKYFKLDGEEGQGGADDSEASGGECPSDKEGSNSSGSEKEADDFFNGF